MDCDLQPTAAGRVRCSRCGWEYHKLVHRNCPVPPDPAVVALRTARLAVCIARGCLGLADADFSNPESPIPNASRPYCSSDRFATGTGSLTVCQLRALFAALLLEEFPTCRWWPGAGDEGVTG